jgi:hypothetical protein
MRTLSLLLPVASRLKENPMDQKKIERIAKGIVKSQQQEAQRAADRERAVDRERASRTYCVTPRFDVLEGGHA